MIYYSVVDPYPVYRSDLLELFCVELPKLGMETQWFMGRGDNIKKGPFFLCGHQEVKLPFKTFDNNFFRQISYLFSDLFFVISLFFCDIDAIQYRDKYFVSFFGLIVSKLKGVPFFYWCSYPFPEHEALNADKFFGVRGFLLKIKAKIRFFWLYKVVCAFADHVFVQSERMREDMRQYGIPSEKMTAVPMGAPARIVSWKKNNKVSVVPMRIVYLGTLASARHLDMLLEAFSLILEQVPDAQLFFVGDGDHPWEKEALENRAEELELARSVTFTGFVPMEEAWSYCASAAVCVSPFYPSKVLASASPTKLIEYMALGRPVVCNDHPEQSKIIEQSGAGICVEWSAPAFASAIIEFLLNPDRAEEIALKGPVWVDANRTYPLIAKMVFSKYQELLGYQK